MIENIKNNELPTVMDNIKFVHSKVQDKRLFEKVVGEEYGLSPATVRVNYFSLWYIPEERQARILQIGVNIANQEFKNQTKDVEYINSLDVITQEIKPGESIS